MKQNFINRQLDIEPGEVKPGYVIPSFGMQLVGISFNPSGDERVNRLKMLAAEMADIVNEAQPADGNAPSYLFNLVKGNALREILNAQMNAVKLVTLK